MKTPGNSETSAGKTLIIAGLTFAGLLAGVLTGALSSGAPTTQGAKGKAASVQAPAEPTDRLSHGSESSSPIVTATRATIGAGRGAGAREIAEPWGLKELLTALETDYANVSGSTLTRLRLLQQLREHIVPEDVPQLVQDFLAQVDEKASPYAHWGVINMLYTVMAEADPVGALEAAWKVSDEKSYRHQAVTGAYDVLLENEPLTAWQVLLDESDIERLKIYQGKAIKAVAQEHPKLVLDYLSATPNGGIMDYWRWNLKGLSDDQRKIVADHLLQEKNGIIREKLLDGFLEAYAAEATEEALHILENIAQPGLRRKASDRLFAILAYRQPEKAAELLRNGKVGDSWDYQVKNVIEGLAEKDVSEARELFEQLDGRKAEYAATALAGHLLKNDRQAAIAFYRELDEPELQIKVKARMVKDLAENNLEEARALLQELGIMDQDADSVTSLMYGMVSAAPEEIWPFAQDLPSDMRRESLERVVSGWTWENPLAAADFTMNLPDTERTSKMMWELGETWGRKDPNAAARWLSGLPAGEHRDAAVRAFADKIRTDDPVGALEWAQTLESPEHRTKLQVKILKDWKKAYPAEAEEFVTSTQLPETVLEQLEDD